MFNLANIKKTWYYLQKNGISDTFYAVLERLYARKSDLYPDKGYRYQPVSQEELEKQRRVSFTKAYKFSILVPMYETKPEFAKAMIDSVLAQTYPEWELILADASKSSLVQDTVSGYDDERIRYYRLEKNAGISENTNAALALAEGDYIGLLDHDDLLTQDALFEMASCMEAAERAGKQVAFVYSDEDKCDTLEENYYEPNIKPAFNWDLLLSNNYICHFLVMKTELMKKLQFRSEYDGAQDFDLVLRAALYKNPEDVILHVDKVLYHWRCHDASTAANPRSKQYAYEAGKRASLDALYVYLQQVYKECWKAAGEKGDSPIYGNMLNGKTADDFLANGILVSVQHTKHNGFYRVVYGKETAEDIFNVRKDVGIIAWSMKKHNKITGGILDSEGKCPYAGMHARFSGYLHRNSLVQNCDRVNLTNAVIRKEIYTSLSEKEMSNLDLMQKEQRICQIVRGKGYRILYDPMFDRHK